MPGVAVEEGGCTIRDLNDKHFFMNTYTLFLHAFASLRKDKGVSDGHYDENDFIVTATL